jgi:hypothetical protein
MIQQRQVKRKEPIPEFKSREEEAAFWDTHDVGEYLNDFNRLDCCILPFLALIRYT